MEYLSMSGALRTASATPPTRSSTPNGYSRSKPTSKAPHQPLNNHKPPATLIISSAEKGTGRHLRRRPIPNSYRRRTTRHGQPRNLAISALRLHGHGNIAAALRWTARDPARSLQILGIT